mmetsp:Transcript_6533/g.20345  ORF Transcript_6533/g.20345 Transcript_6533/m.20345 type:complete len:234 (-) Transcript_6533:234-935(-)
MRRWPCSSLCSFCFIRSSAAILTEAASSSSSPERPCIIASISDCSRCCACSCCDNCLCSSICARSVPSCTSKFCCSASGPLVAVRTTPTTDGSAAPFGPDGAAVTSNASTMRGAALSDESSPPADGSRLATFAGGAPPEPPTLASDADRFCIMQRYFWRCDLMFALVRPSTSISLRMDFGLALSRPSVLHAASNCACSSGVQTKRGRLWWCSSGAGGGVSGGERAVAWIGMLL